MGDVSIHLNKPPQDIPIWQQIIPIEPPGFRVEGGTQIYTHLKVSIDYEAFCAGLPFYNPEKPIREKQKDLFRLYEEKIIFPGEKEPIMSDPVQAFEWVRAKARNEWTPVDYQYAIDKLPDGEDKLKLKKLYTDEKDRLMQSGKQVPKYKAG